MNRSLLSRVRRLSWIAGLLVLAMSGLAFAQVEECPGGVCDTEVKTTVAGSTRILTVHDVDGSRLQEMTLRSGVARPFEARVTDENKKVDEDFDVVATMNNLYQVEGGAPVYGTVGAPGPRIPSGNVEVTFGADPLGIRSLTAGLTPRYVLNMAEGAVLKCTSNVSINLLNLLGTLNSIFADNPLCKVIHEAYGLTSSLVDIQRLLSGADTLVLSNVPLELPNPLDVSLDALGLVNLPLSLQSGSTSSFTAPDCANGIGAADPACGSASAGDALLLMSRRPAGALNLGTLLDDLLPGVTTLVSETGANALLSVDELLAQLGASNAPLVGSGGASSTVSALNDTLAGLSAAQLNALFSVTQEALGVLDFNALTGQYRSFPMLRVNTAGASAGEYAGTLTVRLDEDLN